VVQLNIPHKLLSTLYATASDHSKWQVFCDELKTVSTVPVMMFGHNLGTHESLGIIASGLDPAELDRYHHHFADKNPWMHMNAVMPVGLVGVSDQALHRDDLIKTEFYNDWLQPQENILAGPFMMCSGETFVGLAAACPARHLDKTLPDSFGLLEALALHITQAISMSSVLTNGGPTTFGHLEASKHGIIVLCRSGRIALLNASAERFLSRAHVMSINPHERLTAKDEVIRNYLAAAQRAMSTNAFAKLPKPQHIETSALGECILHAHIFPSDIQHEFPASAWMDPVIGAIVITGERGLQQHGNFGQLAQSLGATPAETRLAEAVMTGQTLYDYADANTLSRHTVRNQMRALLSKTRTENQAEFVRKMYNLSSPFTIPGD